MKNTIKFYGVITLVVIIGFSLTTCGSDDKNVSTGRLIITDFPAEYNGKYFFSGGGHFGEIIYVGEDGTIEFEDNDKVIQIIGAVSITEKEDDFITKGGRINNGSVTLNVWEWDYNTAYLIDFIRSGSGYLGFFVSNMETSGPKIYNKTETIGEGWSILKFENGEAKLKFFDFNRWSTYEELQ